MKGKTKRGNGSDRRSRLLRAATTLFADRGFQGATTREIAARAGINEALIFRDFPRKEDLYWAVLEEKCRVNKGGQIIRQQLSADRNAVETLTAVAEGILRRGAEDPTLARLWLFSGLESHRLAARFYRTFLADFYEILAGYIRAKIREGRFRSVDPLVAARAFTGMVFHHFLIFDLLGGKKLQPYEPRLISRTIATIWLGGMLAPAGNGNYKRAAQARKGL